MGAILFVVGEEFRSPFNELSIFRMHNPSFHTYNNGFIHFVAGYCAYFFFPEIPFFHEEGICIYLDFFVVAPFFLTLSSVSKRAISLRCARILIGLSIGEALCCSLSLVSMVFSPAIFSLSSVSLNFLISAVSILFFNC